MSQFDNIYEFYFDLLLKRIKERCRKQDLDPWKQWLAENESFIFNVGGTQFHRFYALVRASHALIESTIIEILKKMFESIGIIPELYIPNSIMEEYPYSNWKHIPYEHKLYKSPFAFVINEKDNNGYEKRIGFKRIELLSSLPDHNLRISKEEFYNDIDRIFYIDLSDYKNNPILHEVEKSRKQSTDYIQRIFIRDLFDKYFGDTEFDHFLNYVAETNIQINYTIGMSPIEIGSDESIKRFSVATKQLLLKYDHYAVKPSKEYEELVRRYTKDGYYKAMLSNENFAQSFLSSEWYYQCYYKNDKKNPMEKTSIAIGYIKSIEQLLYWVLCQTRESENCGVYRTIKVKKGLEIKFVPFIKENEDLYDKTLGSLISFLRYPENLKKYDPFIVNPTIRQKIIDTLDTWRYKYRNGHTHQDNIYTGEEVKKIRKEALNLYFLILSGMCVPIESLNRIGIFDDKTEKVLKFQKTKFEEQEFYTWLDKEIEYELPRNIGNHLEFYADNNLFDEGWQLHINIKNSDASIQEEYSGKSKYAWADNQTCHESFLTLLNSIKNYINNHKESNWLKEFHSITVAFSSRDLSEYKRPEYYEETISI